MEEKVIHTITELVSKHQTVLDIWLYYDKKYEISAIQQIMQKTDVKNKVRNTFGKCGIHPEHNPCGDADEY